MLELKQKYFEQGLVTEVLVASFDSKSSIHLPENASWGQSPYSGRGQIVKNQLVVYFATTNAKHFEYSVCEKSADPSKLFDRITGIVRHWRSLRSQDVVAT